MKNKLRRILIDLVLETDGYLDSFEDIEYALKRILKLFKIKS